MASKKMKKYLTASEVFEMITSNTWDDDLLVTEGSDGEDGDVDVNNNEVSVPGSLQLPIPSTSGISDLNISTTSVECDDVKNDPDYVPVYEGSTSEDDGLDHHQQQGMDAERLDHALDTTDEPVQRHESLGGG